MQLIVATFLSTLFMATLLLVTFRPVIFSRIKQENFEIEEEAEEFRDFFYWPETLRSRAEMFDPLRSFIQNCFQIPFANADTYNELSRRICLLKEIEDDKFFYALLSELAPWIKKWDQIMSPNEDKGVVMSVGNDFIIVAIQAISVLRYWDPNIRIHVTYNGMFDLTATNRQLLSSTNVTLSNICDHFDCIQLDLDKWDGKPFALLASPFKETILMDADTVFIKNPWILLEDEGYLKTGALFFHDRTLFPGNYGLSKWISEALPKPVSPQVLESRIFRAQTQYEQESGVIAVDKSKHLISLLSVCILNTPFFRETIRMMTHGEKETFWMGFEVANSIYEFMPTMPGSIGHIEEASSSRIGKQKICGKLAHFDRNGELIWFNDGLSQSKRESEEGVREPAILTHCGQEGKWSYDLCLMGDLKPLPKELIDLIGRFQAPNIT